MPFLFSFLLLTFNFLLSTRIALAQCPVCIVTVGGGMLIANKLGIDDLLVSIWISALNTAIAFWLATKFKNKYLKNGHLVAVALLLTTLGYFYFTDQTGGATLWGVDKIILGQIVGLLAMAIANHAYLFVKQKLGHTPFPYAKVAFPFFSVSLATLIFYLIISSITV